MWQINLAERHSFWVCSSPPITFKMVTMLTLQLNCISSAAVCSMQNSEVRITSLSEIAWWHLLQPTIYFSGWTQMSQIKENKNANCLKVKPISWKSKIDLCIKRIIRSRQQRPSLLVFHHICFQMFIKKLYNLPWLPYENPHFQDVCRQPNNLL